MAGSAGVIASLRGAEVTAGGGLIGEKPPSDDDRRNPEAENGKMPSFL